MTTQGRTRELTVGITLTLALALLAGAITMLGGQTRLFGSQNTYSTKVSNSLGLKPGSPVVMGGVQIGSVLSVALPREAKETGIDVTFGVDRVFAERIRQDSTATVGFITLLSGEKFVEISAGSAAQPPVADAGFIPPARSETLLEAGQNVADIVGEATEQLKEILEKINRGEGLIGKIVNEQDPFFGEQVILKMHTTLERTNAILERIEAGEGIAGRLVSDRAYADETLGSIRSASARLDRVLAMVESSEGAAGALIQPGGEGRAIVENLKATTTSLRTVSARLEMQTGVFGRLVNDAAYSEAVAADLRSISQRLESILKKIDEGEGTMGQLINDPSVYEGLRDIVKGIQGSKFATGMMRRYGKKGAKQREEEGAVPPAEPREPAPAPPPPGEPPPPGSGASGVSSVSP